MGMLIFKEAGVEYLVMETGLGGRLDATNSIGGPLTCILTSIGLDHTEILGNTLEEIAAEKAGILKPHVPVIFADTQQESSRVIEEMCIRHRESRRQWIREGQEYSFGELEQMAQKAEPVSYTHLRK